MFLLIIIVFFKRIIFDCKGTKKNVDVQEKLIFLKIL